MRTQTKRCAVVIGAGIGGCTLAALLAKAGRPVTLLEKNPRIGGSCSFYEKRGFQVDYGTHMFSRGHRGPLGQALRRVGAHVEFRRVSDLVEVRGPGVRLVLPAEPWRLPLFCAEAVRQLRIPLVELPRIIKMFYDLVSMSPAQIRAWDGRTIEDFIVQYTENPQLFGLFGFLLGLYFILPPWQVSAGEAIFSFQGMVKDNCLSYPVGGASAIPRGFVDAMLRYGGRLETRAQVAAIEKRPRGWRVTLKDGRELDAENVVSTSTLRDTVRMVGAAHFPSEFVARTEAVRSSYVAVQVKVALPRRLEKAGCIVGGWSPNPAFDPWHVTRQDYRRNFEDLDAGRVPKVVPVYCPIPTNFDPSLAPPGGQLLTACAVAPTTDITRPHASDASIDRAFIEGLLGAMRGLIPGCLDEALFVDTVSTRGLEAWIGKVGGPAVSTGQTPDQVGALRPSVRTPLAGLYVCGDAAGGRGIGTELACASAIECFEAMQTT